MRTVFIIGPDKKIKLMLAYPMTTGRNFDEVLRVIDSMQLTAKHKVATPVNWKQGEDVIIAGSVSDEEAKEIYPEGWKSPRPYIRIVPAPDTNVVGQLLGATSEGPVSFEAGPLRRSGGGSVQAATVRRRTRLRPPAHIAMMSALPAAPAKTAFQSVPPVADGRARRVVGVACTLAGGRACRACAPARAAAVTRASATAVASR